MKKINIIIALLLIGKATCTQSQNLLVGLQGCYPLDNSAANMAVTGSALNGTPVNYQALPTDSEMQTQPMLFQAQLPVISACLMITGSSHLPFRFRAG